MTTYNTITPYLFLATFIVALAVGVWQYMRARKARAEHHRSAGARANNEPRTASSNTGSSSDQRHSDRR